MATSRKFKTALDSYFILFVEAGAEIHEKIFAELDKRKFEFILTDTALQEIQFMAEQASRPEFSKLAKDTLRHLAERGIKTPGLKAVENGCAEVIANLLSDKYFLDAASKNEALLVAEASLHECDFLIMLENSLDKVDGQKLNLALIEKGGNPISILSAEKVLQTLNQFND